MQIMYTPSDYLPGLVAIPTQSWMWTESAIAFTFLPQGLPPGSAIRFGKESSSPAWNRNKLTEEFLRDAPAHGWEWILFIDSDMVPPVGTIMRLLSHGVDCVGAYYFSRREPLVAEFGRVGEPDVEPNADGLFPVRWVGAGCLLVTREVMEKIPEPWFEHPNPGEGEDIVFSAKVKAAGFAVHVDLACQIGHMAARPITRATADAYFASPEGKSAMARATAGSDSYQQRTAAAIAQAGR
jgi:hypothetical protein